MLFISYAGIEDALIPHMVISLMNILCKTYMLPITASYYGIADRAWQSHVILALWRRVLHLVQQ